MTDYTPWIITAVLVFIAGLVLLWRSIVVIAPDHQGVVTRFGAFRGILQPGFNVVHPTSVVMAVDLRDQPLRWGPESFSFPSGNVALSASITFRIIDARKALFQARDLPALISDQLRASLFGRIGELVPGAPEPSDFELTRAATNDLQPAFDRYGVKLVSLVVQRNAAPLTDTPPNPVLFRRV